MTDILSVEGIVKSILQKDKKARNNDALLYLKVCKAIRPKACKLPFDVVMSQRNELGLPNYETVGRARRKLQAEDESLKADTSVKEARAEREKEFKNYALS